MTPATHPPRDLLLDLLRGLAALLVCAGHLRSATLVDAGDAAGMGPWSQLLYLSTSLGHQSVMVFFVLSGYLVGGSVMSAGRRFDTVAYARARLSRLWTVLMPCLALTWVVDQLVWHLAPAVLSGAYAVTWHSAPSAGRYDASWPTALGNVLFLQTIAVPVFGSNGPLWSLANEFWYYLLFPLLTHALAGRHMGATVSGRFAAALAMLALMAWLPAELLQGFAIWLMGAAAFTARRSTRCRTAITGMPVLAVAAFLASLGFSKWSATHAWSLPWGDWVLGMGTAFLLWQGPHITDMPKRPHLRRAIERLSDMSFSLYLSHFPLVMLVGALGFVGGRMQPTPLAWTWLAGLLGLLLMVGQLVWWLFERQTPRVRQALSWQWHRSIRLPPGS